MYTVMGSVNSRTFRVLWMLEELGQPYEHRPEPPRSDAVRALNPSGKIPVLIDEGVPLTDSTAILQYLADRHRMFTHPAGTRERARQDGWTYRLLDELEAPLWSAAKHSFVLPEAQRVPAVKDSLRWEFSQGAARLAERMGEGPWLMGAQFTVPDIVLGHICRWAGRAGFDVEAPALLAHAAACAARPAFACVAAL